MWISQIWHDCRKSGLDCWAIDGLPLAMARTVGLAGGLSGGKRRSWSTGDIRTQHCASRATNDRCTAGGFTIVRSEKWSTRSRMDSISRSTKRSTLSNRTELWRRAASRAPTRGCQGDHERGIGTLDELVRQLGRTLQFTEMQRRHLQPTTVWLMGGGASMKNIGPYLAGGSLAAGARLDVGIRGGADCVRRGKPRGRVRQRGGVVLAGLEGSMRTAINLLPQSFRRQQILRKRLVQWASIISAVLVTGWGWHWYEMREDRQLAQQLETLSREHGPTQSNAQATNGNATAIERAGAARDGR